MAPGKARLSQTGQPTRSEDLADHDRAKRQAALTAYVLAPDRLSVRFAPRKCLDPSKESYHAAGQNDFLRGLRRRATEVDCEALVNSAVATRGMRCHLLAEVLPRVPGV